MSRSKSGFTLIELLVVMGILGILMAVTILVINPTEYLKRSRDTNRISEIEVLHKALSLYMANSSGASLGVTGDVYVSLPSVNSNCSDLGLPVGPTYHCVTVANLTKTNGTGWVPVNLATGAISPPLSKLPIDPTNTVTGGKYYTYVPNYQLTSCFESTKYASQYPTDCVAMGITTNTPNVILGRVVNTLVIGNSYGGGIVAYILQSGDPGYVAGVQHGLIAATTDQSTEIYWHATNVGTTGASGTALGTGNANTNTIVAFYGTESNAGRLCYDLSLNNYTDWYLPSKDELNKLYLNQVTIGGFAAYIYWSSSEYSATGAWKQDFNDGSLGSNNKNFSGYVRCVRGF